MKIVVFSDIHGRSDLVARVLSLHRSANAVLFLGDGIRDLPYDLCTEGGKLFAGVRGNCDAFFLRNTEYSYSEELLLNLDSYTVMMMHGHLYSVKSGMDLAVRHAAERGANILLYGHTHIPEERYLPEGHKVAGSNLPHPMYVMNPGSLGAPRNGIPTYGLIQIRNNQLLLSHGTIQ